MLQELEQKNWILSPAHYFLTTLGSRHSGLDERRFSNRGSLFLFLAYFPKMPAEKKDNQHLSGCGQFTRTCLFLPN